MTRMVMCRKHQQELAGLARPPFPGSKGEDIYNNISQQAWDEWQTQQTMLINERHLNMMDAEDRKFLMAEMESLLTLISGFLISVFVLFPLIITSLSTVSLLNKLKFFLLFWSKFIACSMI